MGEMAGKLDMALMPLERLGLELLDGKILGRFQIKADFLFPC